MEGVELMCVVCGGRETCLIPLTDILSLLTKSYFCMKGSKLCPSWYEAGRRKNKRRPVPSGCVATRREGSDMLNIQRCALLNPCCEKRKRNWSKFLPQGTKKKNQSIAMLLVITISRKEPDSPLGGADKSSRTGPEVAL